jgi:hypothetical protein
VPPLVGIYICAVVSSGDCAFYSVNFIMQAVLVVGGVGVVRVALYVHAGYWDLSEMLKV